MKYAVLSDKYPKEGDFYRNGFIHQRNIIYKENGKECKVFIINEYTSNNIYQYGGIEVVEGSYSFIKENLISWKPDRILIHFIDDSHMQLLNDINYSIPTTIWIHGVEALSWTRRLFNFNGKRFLWYIVNNTKKLRHMKKFVNQARNINFVFVSHWMKEVMEKDVGVKINNYKIIPNVINTDLYSYKPKNLEQRKRILIIRNFDSRKYANDISIKAIKKLMKKSYFKDLQFSIYGQGKYFDKLTNDLKGLKNVNLNNTFLPQSKISEIHKDFGVFLCPTRQDSQGVSMCEAMSSGLVPITSNNTAIPEFVDENSGYLLNNRPESIVKAVEELYFNAQEFTRKSLNSHNHITLKCNREDIIENEIKFIENPKF